ncbi:MAG: sigma-70 family RNA polymerase sigma factor [Candidatus Delongbacteria bacterium]
MHGPHAPAPDRFWQLLEPQWPALCALARQLAPPGEDHDLLQDCLFKGLTGLPGLREEARFRPWMARILVHEARRRWRRGLWRRWLPGREGGEAGTEPTHGASAEEHLQRWHLKAALASLRPERRETLLLHYLGGLSLAEVAEARGESLAAVKTRIHRARRELRDLLDGRLNLALIGRSCEEELDHGFERELEARRLQGQES